MELRHLRYFEAVASELNFTRAAERLNIAQPPLSRQIQQLEDELGVVLIDRSTRPMALTRAGAFFYEQSVQLLARVDEVAKAAQRLGQGRRRWIGVGFVPSMLYGALPRAVHGYMGEFPEIDVVLSELTSVQQVEALKSGRIDVGFGRVAIEDDALVHTVIEEEPLVVALPAASALAAQPELTLAALAQEMVIVYPAQPRPSFADQVLAHFRVRGHPIARTFETNGLQTAIGLVAAGIGVTLVARSVQRLKRDDVVYRPIRDSGAVTPMIMSTRRADSSADLLALCERVRAACAAEGVPG